MASTAAGNDQEATVLGIDRGTVSGIAPRAHISSYKACVGQFCISSDLLAAINKAVADGVHVINYSIADSSFNP